MTRERRTAGATDPPQPQGVRTAEELAGRLRELRAWSGVSYRTVHREVVRLRTARGVPEQPVYNTVYRCFQTGRTRLDVELVVDIARVLLGDDAAAAAWRNACRVISGYSGSDIVEVTDQPPAESDGFVGRAAEVRALCAAPGIAVVAGMAGVGKTRLAFQAAREIRADVRLAVDLRGFDPARPPADPAAVLEGFLRCLGVSGEQIGLLDMIQRTQKYRQMLAGKRVVVVLDNAASLAQVEPLLASSPTCITLITSRHALDVPGARHVSLGTFSAAEVAEFLRAEQIDIDDPAATEIGELVAYLPLALVIVAARIKTSPEWTVADHLDRLRHQRSTMRLDDAVEAAISLSYQNLPRELRRTFLLLAKHVGDDLTAYDAAAMADIDLASAHRQLDQLLSEQLLQQKTPGRYGFHDLVRRYAIDRAADELPIRARRAATTRLIDNYVFTAAQAMNQYAPYERDRRPTVEDPGTPAPDFTDKQSAAGWLDTERTSLIAAAIFADEHEQPAKTRAMSAILWRYLYEAGNFGDAETLHKRSLHTAQGWEQGRELSRLGAASFLIGRPSEAVEWFTRALKVAREIDDPREMRRALNGLGNTYWSLGRPDDAVSYHLQALDIARQLGDRLSEEISVGNLGAAYERLGRYDEALAMFKQDADIAGEIGNLDGRGNALINAAVICTRLGRLAEALELSTTAAQVSDSRPTEARALGQLGAIYCRLGRYDESVDHHQRALAITQGLSSPADEGMHLNRLGDTFLHQQRYAEALDAQHQALDIAVRDNEKALEANARISLAECLACTGRPAEAAEHYRQALSAAEATSDLYEQARAHHGLAEIAAGDRHRHEAVRLYDRLGVRGLVDYQKMDRRRSSN